MRLLLFLITVDPDFTSIFLCCNQLLLLVDFIEELLALNIILLLQRLLLDLQCVCLALYLRQLTLLLVEFALIYLQHLVALMVCLLYSTELPLKFCELVLSLLTHIVAHSQVLVRISIVFLEPQEILTHALVLDLKRGIVCVHFIKLGLKGLHFSSKHSHPLISIFLDFIDTDDLSLVLLRLFEEIVVHLLDLLLLELVLLLHRLVFLQCQLQMRLFTGESVDKSLFRLLNQLQLTHLLVLVFDQQIFLFDNLLGPQQFLLDHGIGPHFLFVFDLERFNAFVLV